MEYLSNRNSLKEKLSAYLLKGEGSYDDLVMEVLHFQLKFNHFYNRFFELLGCKTDAISSVFEIPCLPVSMLKGRRVSAFSSKGEKVFFSSGTTHQIKSQHHIPDLAWYDLVTLTTFSREYGDLENYNFLALLPNYMEQGNSSLIHMVRNFMLDANQNIHGMFSDSDSEFFMILEKAMSNGKKTIILGVTFALMDLSEKISGDFPSECIVMETGGMKGRRKELVREELHKILKSSLNVDSIHSEYGMTELQSQAYSKGDGNFIPGPLLRVFTKDLYDLRVNEKYGHSGLINLIDLANFETIPFLSTNDLGISHINGSFEVIGRLDGSEQRGCNLMYGNF